MEGIAAAQEALELLIPAGDFAGALDVLSDLTAAGTPMHVVGLHAFRDLPQQLAGAEEVWPPFTRCGSCNSVTARLSVFGVNSTVEVSSAGDQYDDGGRLSQSGAEL